MSNLDQQDDAELEAITPPTLEKSNPLDGLDLDFLNVENFESHASSVSYSPVQCLDDEEESGSFFKGLLIGLPISLLLWVIIISSVTALITFW